MRMPAIKPADLTDEQRELDQFAREIMEGVQIPFTAMDEDGALIGPFPVMLRFPGPARPLLEWFPSVTSESALERVRVRSPC